MHNDEESSFTELGELMKRIKAVESIARHHEDAVIFHTRAGQKALQQAEKARADAKSLRELYKLKSTIGKFATAFRESEIAHTHDRDRHARVDSVMDTDAASYAPPKYEMKLDHATAAADAKIGKEEKPKLRTVLRSPRSNDTGISEVPTLRISQANASFTSLAIHDGHQNASSEYTTISSSFVQRVAKRKESITALQSMNPIHQRTLSEPTRTIYAKPVQVEDVEEQVVLESELEHIKAFL